MVELVVVPYKGLREDMDKEVERAQALKKIGDSSDEIISSNDISDEKKVGVFKKTKSFAHDIFEACKKGVLFEEIEEVFQRKTQVLEQEKAKISLSLPKPGENYSLYPGRTDALAWLGKHWGHYLKHFNPDLERDYLYQDQLGKLDPKLLRAVIDQVAYKKKKGEFDEETKLSDFIPPKKKRIDLEVASVMASLRTGNIKEIYRIGAATKRRVIFEKR